MLFLKCSVRMLPLAVFIFILGICAIAIGTYQFVSIENQREIHYHGIGETIQVKTEQYQNKDNNIDYEGTLKEVAKIRNSLSKELNQMSKTLGQMQCELTHADTNEHGGWCRKMSMENSIEHNTDKVLIPVLSKFLHGKTVASFGDGPGIYKREIIKLGQVQTYDDYDGAPFCEEISNGSVKFMDLTIPQYGIPLYDWIISLEVAEHIPNNREGIYLDNIFRHAKEGIILSWAVPGQVGLSHINNRPLEYVINVMKKNGFESNQTLSKHLQSSSSLEWLQNNMYVYMRKRYDAFGSKTRLVQWFLYFFNSCLSKKKRTANTNDIVFKTRKRLETAEFRSQKLAKWIDDQNHVVMHDFSFRQDETALPYF